LRVDHAFSDSMAGEAASGVNIGGSGGDGEVNIDDQIKELNGKARVAVVSSTRELGGLDNEISVGLVKEVIAASGNSGSVNEAINGINVRITPRESLGSSWVAAAHIGEGVSPRGTNALSIIENGNSDGASQEDSGNVASDLSTAHISSRDNVSIEATEEGS